MEDILFEYVSYFVCIQEEAAILQILLMDECLKEICRRVQKWEH